MATDDHTTEPSAHTDKESMAARKRRYHETAAAKRGHTIRHRVPIRDDGTRECSKCHAIFPETAEYFGLNQACRLGLCPWCKACEKQRAQEKAQRLPPEERWEASRRWYWTHHEYALAHDRAYTKDHPGHSTKRWHIRRARQQNAPSTFTDAEWRFALEYWGFCCAVCGAQDGLWGTLHRDHWIPLATPESPGYVATNIIPLCGGRWGCNQSKNNKAPEEWLVKKLGKRKAAQKLKEIAAFFAIVEAS